jgi:hypothetical protein
LEDFKLRTDIFEERREHPVTSKTEKIHSREEISQSERDWAFAKRALARGDDPEEVIRRIADYRADEKHPNYAGYTVEKAQAALQGKPSSRVPTVQGLDTTRDSIEIP